MLIYALKLESKPFPPKTVAKLAFLIGNLLQVDSRLLSSPSSDRSHIYSRAGVIKAAAGTTSGVILSSVKVGRTAVLVKGS